MRRPCEHRSIYIAHYNSLLFYNQINLNNNYMKKIYFLLVAMLVGFAANAADYYLIGGALGWDLKNEKGHFTDKGDGIYELKFQGSFTSGFKVNDGTWSNPNINFGSNGNKLVIGTPYAYANGSSNNIDFDGTVTDPTITLDINNGTILVAGEAQESDLAYCIWGSLKSGAWAATDFSDEDNDGIWTIENVEVTYASAAFGIRSFEKSAGNGSQKDWIAADGASKITGEGTFKCKVNSSTNFSIAKGTYSFSFNPETMVLNVTGGGQGGDDPDPETKEVYLAGKFNDYTAGDAAYKFTTTDNKIYTLKIDGSFSSDFKVIVDGTWSGNTTPMVSGTAYPLSDIGMSNCTLASAATDPEFVYDDENNTITVNYGGGDDPDPEDYTKWYLNVQGPFNNYEPVGVAFSKEGYAEAKNLAIGTSEFELKIWNGKKDLFYANNAEPIQVDQPYTVGEGQGAKMTIADATDASAYDISYDIPTMTMIVKKAQSGVEVIEAENAAPEYFNLQGVKVAEPTQGLYIVRRGNTVTKEIVK